MIDWDQLVKERNEWIAHNFPEQKAPPGFETTMGVIEEVGELAHHHLKELQNIRGTPEEHQAQARDAIGDISVYLLGVMNYAKYQPRPYKPVSRLYVPKNDAEALLKLAKVTGRIAGSISRNVRPLRIDIDQTIYYMDKYCEFRGWDYEAIVLETWGRVKQRDWQKNKQTGGDEIPVHDEFGGDVC